MKVMIDFNKIKTIPKMRPGIKQYGYRLDSLQYMIENYLGKRQDWIQFGVASGFSAKFMFSIMPKSNRLFLLDSWQGLPENWGKNPNQKKGAFKNAKIPTFKETNVYMIQSWFKDAWDKLEAYGIDIAFAHIDCDIYSSTVDALKIVQWYFIDGKNDECFLLFDEFYNYPEYENHEYKAFFEAIKKYDWKYEPLFKTAGNQVAFKIWRE